MHCGGEDGEAEEEEGRGLAGTIGPAIHALSRRLGSCFNVNHPAEEHPLLCHPQFSIDASLPCHLRHAER